MIYLSGKRHEESHNSGVETRRPGRPLAPLTQACSLSKTGRPACPAQHRDSRPQFTSQTLPVRIGTSAHLILAGVAQSVGCRPTN